MKRLNRKGFSLVKGIIIVVILIFGLYVLSEFVATKHALEVVDRSRIVLLHSETKKSDKMVG